MFEKLARRTGNASAEQLDSPNLDIHTRKEWIEIPVSRRLRKLGRREWYATSGYSRRSMVENAVFRYKTIFGQRMRSRSLGNQRVEVVLACKILNTMTGLGMPDSVRVR